MWSGGSLWLVLSLRYGREKAPCWSLSSVKGRPWSCTVRFTESVIGTSYGRLIQLFNIGRLSTSIPAAIEPLSCPKYHDYFCSLCWLFSHEPKRKPAASMLSMRDVDAETLELQLIHAGDTEASQAYGKRMNSFTETGGDYRRRPD